MKKSLFALAALAAAGVAQAQSSVTLYGIMDAGVRYTTHADANASPAGNSSVSATSASNSKLAMVGGGMSNSRWGVRGAEDLGGGLKAIFNAESRFNLSTGANDNTGGISFNQVWVGLSTKAGDITLGRQYSLVFDTVTQDYASFGASPYIEVYRPETLLMFSQSVGSPIAGRNDNMIKYAANFSGVKVGLGYALGEQQSNNGTNTVGSTATGNVYGRGSSLQARVGYGAGPVAVGAALQSDIDVTGVRNKIYTAGASFVAGPAKLNAGWITRSIATSAANTDHNNVSVYFGGVNFAATPALSVGGQLWYTKADKAFATNNTFNNGYGNNAKLQGAVVVDYALSKRTDAYFETDYTLRAAKDTATTTYKKPFGAMVGVRHRF